MKTNSEQLLATYRGEKVELFTNAVLAVQAYENLTWSILMASEIETDEAQGYVTNVWQIRAEVSSDMAAAAAEGQPYTLECTVAGIDVTQENAPDPNAWDNGTPSSRFHRLYCLGQS